MGGEVGGRVGCDVCWVSEGGGEEGGDDGYGESHYDGGVIGLMWNV